MPLNTILLYSLVVEYEILPKKWIFLMNRIKTLNLYLYQRFKTYNSVVVKLDIKNQAKREKAVTITNEDIILNVVINPEN